MVGDDPMRGGVVALGRDAGRRLAGADQGAEEIGIVDIGDALQRRGDPLQPHARVDARARQGRALARYRTPRRPLVELHEHEIPDLGEAIAALARSAGRTAGHRGAMIVEDLRAGAARAGVAHRPEVVASGDPDDPLVGQAGDPAPQRGRLLVRYVHGHQQLIEGQAKLAGDQLPGQFDRPFLEVIAEGEVTEHLEEGQVPSRIADIV